jgi:hypothetical protein
LVIVIATAGVVSAQSVSTSTYTPATPKDRLEWFAKSNFSLRTLAGHLVVSGINTWQNSPEEYGPHWDGFGKRIPLRASGVAVNTAIEASVGSLWGEDPRYFRAAGQPFKRRLGHVVKMTFMSYNRQGGTMPAYARYAALSGGGFLQNTWRPDSQTQTSDALMRVTLGLLGRLTSNTVSEFLPDILRRH